MSFQHFRLSEAVVPLQHHLHPAASVVPTTSVQQFQAANTNSTFATNHVPVGPASAKAPYGSGDTDDGYTLVFPNLDAFNEWRLKEEEDQMVEFVKGDTHGSKAVPPRFKDHTKLVCARHSRSGRKKYVKKHPDRVRKVPSRKLEGEGGCRASISYKTYFDTEEVRACYVSQHSHEIGLANLPFTRRGRKAAVEQEKHKPRKQAKVTHPSSGPSSQSATTSNPAGQSREQFSNAISMLAPLPAPYQPVHPAQVPNSYFEQPGPGPAAAVEALSNGRWENMATLFESVRGNARTFEYPSASVAALETVLIRLYLESPLPNVAGVLSNHDPNIQPNLGESSSVSGQGSADDDG
ncbi:hypothetical protein DFH08DRAFT_376519 [Mycena albidolilacea]|uniref:Uncharacterized protein n=1 Tax=Mycena albidolilacea TaxID=1033008 RepID=A0AAD7AKL4_9AGAR|nr:hypothetical protein DFH08DRAFT_376519 [Mycena albidolilacea]